MGYTNSAQPVRLETGCMPALEARPPAWGHSSEQARMQVAAVTKDAGVRRYVELGRSHRNEGKPVAAWGSSVVLEGRMLKMRPAQAGLGMMSMHFEVETGHPGEGNASPLSRRWHRWSW